MARKLKGKTTSKGLKGALLRHQAQEQLNKKITSKQEHAVKKNRPTKAVLNNQKIQRETAAKFIPFEKESTLLLIGEGDFSFARSIIENEYISPANLVVTSYDNSPKELNLKYPKSFQQNYDFLMEHGTKVFFKIDATNLIKSFKLSKKTTWQKIVSSELASKGLQNIMFNFPHTGKGIKDQDRNIRDHQELILAFFRSSKEFFKQINQNLSSAILDKFAQGYTLKSQENGTPASDSQGKVLISVFNGEPYDSWQIKILAKTSGWKVERSNKFQWENYPEYSHKRTNSEQETTKPAAEREARTFIFELYDKKKHAKNGKKSQNAGSDDEN
ncbi:25S rRNA (uracil2634-N3)-methyltransferase [Lachancea thermotolerans CBS 6340]|uniref:KLTH0G10230p n=1 Tax=Lachancea thermotolerans (strain ATCC 56472 / CBS 6340 / NRRL Y-8284) TaxID=559295 RepID=C5DMN0_LACTC|nr:KLTH0G10230p [Lachancea thermotolerans CBS 6340]CAR25041.1 KLTH0G10230p [Lachancea thermotolerans CBS 6340]